jgi:hypothetical protein
MHRKHGKRGKHKKGAHKGKMKGKQ